MRSFTSTRTLFVAILLIVFLTLLGPISAQGRTLDDAQAQNSHLALTDSQNSQEPQPSTVAFLTGPNDGEPLEIARHYIESQMDAWHLTEDDLADQIIRDHFLSSHNDTTHIYFRQRLQGIEVYLGDIGIHVAGDGSIITAQMDYVPDLQSKINTRLPVLSAVEAIEAAVVALNLEITDPVVALSEESGPARSATYSEGGFSQEEIPVKLTYQPLENGQIRLAWEMTIYTLDSLHWWNLRIDAVNGEMLSLVDWVSPSFFGPHNQQHSHTVTTINQPEQAQTSNDSSQAIAPDQYRVYQMPVESPNHTAPAPPADGRTLSVDPADLTASPFGWHDTNGAAGAEFTITRGNNVWAQEDQNGNNGTGASPNGGGTLDFDFALDLTQAPSTYVDAATTNLFYWNNIMHDVWYQYGFDEASGNFQENNYGNGGAGSDSVNADAQDGSGINNANFATPADGSNPRMQMFLWNINPNGPNLDGDFDNGIIAHEYGHGISNRLTGGPGNSNCLNNEEQMGEGWSDWFALMLTLEAGDTGTDARGIGTYVLGQSAGGPGIRPFRYSTDMAANPHTYDSIKTEVAPHGVGSVWAVMLWDLNWALIEQYGFDTDFYTGTGGNNIAMQLVIDGLKLQGCSPGFLSGRDGILLADQNNNGGANQCLIWEVFARRGAGNSALQGSTNDKDDGTEAFDLPIECQLLNPDPTPNTQSICTGANALYTINLDSGFTSPPVTLAASGNPAGTTANFSLNPVPAVPDTSTLTIGNTAGATPGNYTIIVNGDDGSRSEDEAISLNVFDAIPAAPALISPSAGNVDTVLSPVSFSWSAVSQAETYEIDIATDPQFSSIVDSATGLTDTAYESDLAAKTIFFWRVRAVNACGTTANPEIATFQTMDTTCTDYLGGGTGAIPDGTCDILCQFGITPPTPGVATLNLNGVGAGTLIDLDVIGLNGNHTWVSDLDFDLQSPNGTQVTVLPRSCGDSDDYNLNLDDEGTPLFCPLTGGNTMRVDERRSSPPSYLSQFDGEDSNGTWQLTAFDHFPGDTGDVDGWGLRVCHQQAFTADYSDLTTSFDVAYHEGSGTLRLGSGWTADNTFTQDNDNATDDGIVRGGAIWTAGNNVSINATVTGGDGNDYLACWFDWDDSGIFEAGEKTVAQMVANGLNNIAFVVPGTFNPATNSILDTRCRLYEAEPTFVIGTETPNGGVVGGEVEDYRFTFTPTAISLQSTTIRDQSTVWPLVFLAFLLLVLSGWRLWLRPKSE